MQQGIQEPTMSRTVIDLDDEMLAIAQQQLGTTSTRDTINRALIIAAGITAADRARAFRWLQDNAQLFLDFDILAEREQAGL
jgi:Arc/MetJ family transcription regulator